MTLKEVLKELNSHSRINLIDSSSSTASKTDQKLGIGIMKLRALAKAIGKDPNLAHQLWDIPIVEAKILSTLIDEPEKLLEEHLEHRVKTIDSDRLVDEFVKNSVAKTPFLFKKANEWTNMRKPVMVRRAGYECVCNLALKSKVLDNNYFEKHLIIIEIQVNTASHRVREGQCKALISIGSRNKILNIKALNVAQKIGVVRIETANGRTEVDIGSILLSDKVLKKL